MKMKKLPTHYNLSRQLFQRNILIVPIKILELSLYPFNNFNRLKFITIIKTIPTTTNTEPNNIKLNIFVDVAGRIEPIVFVIVGVTELELFADVSVKLGFESFDDGPGKPDRIFHLTRRSKLTARQVNCFRLIFWRIRISFRCFLTTIVTNFSRNDERTPNHLFFLPP